MASLPQPAKMMRAPHRFVAFSFAAADAFMEINSENRITYADGALDWLCRMQKGDLIGKDLSQLLDPVDYGLVISALRRLPRAGRLKPLRVGFGLEANARKRVMLTAVRLPDSPDTTYLTFRALSLLPAAEASSSKKPLPNSNLHDRKGFVSLAAEIAENAGAAGEDLEMVLIEIAGLADFLRTLSKDQADAVLEDLSSTIRSLSLEGQSGGMLQDDKFAVVRDGSITAAELTQIVRDTIATYGADGRMSAKTINVPITALDVPQRNPMDMTRALAFTINQFVDSTGLDGVTSLEDNYAKVLAETQKRIDAFRTTIEENRFEMALQPIVELNTSTIHHYEALARMWVNGSVDLSASPFQFITFAEETGLIPEFDLAMTRRAIQRIEAARQGGSRLSLAVNISGRSIENDQFIESLQVLLRNNMKLRDSLLFELTESSTIADLKSVNKKIAALRTDGFKVCLDDFGAGAAGFQYLREIQVDYVKIDGIYVVEALANSTGRFFLKSMVSLCHDLGIKTIGERVETQDHVNLLMSMGVRYGQGYHYSRPGEKSSHSMAI